MKAYCQIREQPHYRREAFVDGLRAAGYEVMLDAPARGAPGDVLLIWNRYSIWHVMATAFEAGGGTVIVAENGYLGPHGVSPHGMEPRSIYALALRFHNGAGEWFVGDRQRFEALQAPLQPMRKIGGHVLVAANRPFGLPGFSMPANWAWDTAARITRETGWPVRVRLHPGNAGPVRPLALDLDDCHAVVIWSSSVGVTALLNGVPVVCEAPSWILKPAAARCLADVDAIADRRLDAFERLAWAQWEISEIETGEPFERLKQCACMRPHTSTA